MLDYHNYDGVDSKDEVISRTQMMYSDGDVDTSNSRLEII